MKRMAWLAERMPSASGLMVAANAMMDTTTVTVMMSSRQNSIVMARQRVQSMGDGREQRVEMGGEMGSGFSLLGRLRLGLWVCP